MIDFNRNGKLDTKDVIANMIVFRESGISDRETEKYQNYRRREYRSSNNTKGIIFLLIFAFLVYLLNMK